MADPTGTPLPMAGVANAGIGSLFPQVNAQSNPLYAAATAGMNQTTGSAAAGQQLTLQDIINQSQGINLQNQQADQPNIAAQRNLTGMNIASDTAQQPAAAAANMAKIQAAAAQFAASKSDSEVKDLFSRTQSIKAADDIISAKDEDGKPTFDPIRDSGKINDILNKAHPGDDHSGVITPQKMAEIHAMARSAPAVMQGLSQSSGALNQQAVESIKARSQANTSDVAANTSIAVANIQSKTELQKGMLGMLMTAAGNAAKFQEELVKLPLSQQAQSVAIIEQNKNGGVISDTTYNKLVSTQIKDFDSNAELKQSIGKATEATRTGILAGDLDVAKRRAVAAGVFTQHEVDDMKDISKPSFSGKVAEKMIKDGVKQKATAYVDSMFSQHNSKVQPMNMTEAAQYATAIGTNILSQAQGAVPHAPTPASPTASDTSSGGGTPVTAENLSKFPGAKVGDIFLGVNHDGSLKMKRGSAPAAQPPAAVQAAATASTPTVATPPATGAFPSSLPGGAIPFGR